MVVNAESLPGRPITVSSLPHGAIDAGQIVLVPLAELDLDDPTRIDRDEDHIQELHADFVKRKNDYPGEHPIKTPLRVVIRHGRKVIVAGAYRYLAALRVPLANLPCIVSAREFDEFELFTEQARDNGLHKPYTPMEEARNVKKAMSMRPGLSQAEAGRAVGIRNPSNVTKLLKVLNFFPADLQPLIGEGDGFVPFTTAYPFAQVVEKLGDEMLVRGWVEKVRQGLLVRDAAVILAQETLRGGKSPKKAKPVKAKTAKGLQALIPALDFDSILAELGSLVEAVRRAQKFALPLSSLPSLLKSPS